jgi:hypothetical protein
MRPILTRLERLQPALVAATKRASTSAGTADQQLQSLVAAEGDLRAIVAPPELTATHQRVEEALALAGDALLHPGDTAPQKMAEAAALLAWARADLANPRISEPLPRR